MNDDEQRNFLSRFEAAFTQTRDEVQALKQSYLVLQRDINNVAQEIKGFSAKLEEKSKANWPAIGLAVSLFAISVPGLGFVLTTYTAEAVAPVARDVGLIGEIQKRRGALMRTPVAIMPTALAIPICCASACPACNSASLRSSQEMSCCAIMSAAARARFRSPAPRPVAAPR
jgi:hypothetical protein